eukprot:2751400-Pyramimonas_sp.AAC.1
MIAACILHKPSCTCDRHPVSSVPENRFTRVPSHLAHTTAPCALCAEGASATSVITAVVDAAEAYMAADLAINQAIGDHGAAAILSATGKR